MANPGRIRIRVRGSDQASTAISKMDASFDRGLVKEARDRAVSLRHKLRTRTAGAYYKAGTGRFSRGLNAFLDVSKTASGGTRATIKVTAIDYRESKFLTVLVGGYPPPMQAYYIFAKGIAGLFDPVLLEESRLQKGSYGTKRQFAQIGRRVAKGRLKVPKEGYMPSSSRRGGKEGRAPRTATGTAFMHGQPARPAENYYYPLWVKHPGFGEMGDIVEQVVIEEGELWAKETLTHAAVSFDPTNARMGISLISGGVSQVERGTPSGAYTGGIADPVRLARDAGARQARQSIARLTGTRERPTLPRFRDYPIE